ncbi:TlpA family protein disulfide reductase [Ferroacidibacillus organovorans]|uniref:Thioredoxin domain-containing protein n=1 Tax=Ferroacidibacillus organovorans TaxID=1765683 RepID=A0A162TWA5_9BACL|nr:TlpA disulfide reductase family protein [Ferroacidibacillus organovorans]KYP81189.1 hypothetical protein AYJ22_08115 [Ferroacidibacillus organovorans]OAG93888.1 hypothetical protein AYW79_08085 [Ferroacidibacillus organovorans]OPG16014.1 hypothetical protein B2M26_08125 [Ferroacidibacillus organovorans]
MKRKYSTYVLFLVLAGAILAGIFYRPGPAVSPEMGYTAPPLTLNTLTTNAPFSWQSLSGKLYVLNFWASWCPPCNAEAPGFVKAAEKYKGKIEFIGVNMTSADSPPAAIGFIKHYHIPYTVLADVQAKAASAYRIVSIPTTFFVNQKGVIVDRVTGRISEGTLDSLLNQLEKG